MIREHITIPKRPERRNSEDYVALRKKGIELIEKLGSALWTDYNIHDPGITLLELLCYAETEIGFKLGFSIKDILEPHPTVPFDTNTQCFFTAREILTVNPFTANDFRKLLIDRVGVRNAWMKCNVCGCGHTYYADCKTSKLQYEPGEHPIKIKGFWDALIELDVDPELGDLNSGKVFDKLAFPSGSKMTNATVELRFPPWHSVSAQFDQYQSFIAETAVINVISVLYVTGNKTQVVDIPTSELYQALRSPLYATVQVTYKEDPSDALSQTLLLPYVPLKVWYRNSDDRAAITVAMLRDLLEDTSALGAIATYQKQLQQAKAVIDDASYALHRHRNLAEDYCNISTAPLEDIGFCADIEVRPDVDIEALLAEAYWQIAEYFNPTVLIYSLEELLDRKMASEEIFHGPKLDHGFILDADLDASELRTHLYVSDVINILMDIDGVISVQNATLVRFDTSGKAVESQPWVLEISDGHLPRFYTYGSKVLVFKNDLPFLPDPDELNDSLLVWHGANQQTKMQLGPNDLAIPRGTFVDLASYYPVQYNLPETYGVSEYGLPEPVDDRRRAQAKQLRAYLLVFEYLLTTYIQQLSRFRDILTIDPSKSETYFYTLFNSSLIKEYDLIAGDLEAGHLHALLESHQEFLKRRNAFLDHLLARFAESFSEYALMLTSAFGSTDKAGIELITDKINFLKNYPETSANRAKAFNYTDPALVCHPLNPSGLSRRIQAILGFSGLEGFISYFIEYSLAEEWHGYWEFNNTDGIILLKGTNLTGYKTESALAQELVIMARDAVLYVKDPANLVVVTDSGSHTVVLNDSSATQLAQSPGTFPALADAQAFRDAIIDFVDFVELTEKVYVVEHILLRPRNLPGPDFPEGDPFLPICLTPDCKLCGDEDPYSYRITIVMNGESGVTNTGLAFRKFAEHSIRLETPAHLGLKICWVSHEQMKEFETAWCEWLAALAAQPPDPLNQHNKLKALLEIFNQLKSVYPEARLHDCIDGDDENRVFLNKTVI